MKAAGMLPAGWNVGGQGAVPGFGGAPAAASEEARAVGGNGDAGVTAAGQGEVLTLDEICPDPAVRQLLPEHARDSSWFIALLHELRRQWDLPYVRR